MQVRDLDTLVCPRCRSALEWRGANLELVVQEGVLVCRRCEVRYAVRDGWVRFSGEAPRGGLHRLPEAAPRLLDPAAAVGLRALAGIGPARLARALLDALDLGAIPPTGMQPVRVLVQGVGTGRLLRELYGALPGRGEAWCTDDRVGLLHVARRREARAGRLRRTRFALADAGALPFRDAFFDRALAPCPAAGSDALPAALAEIARTLRPGGVAAVLVRRGGSGLAGLLGGGGGEPEEAVPGGATDVRLVPVGRLHAVLRFALPAEAAAVG